MDEVRLEEFRRLARLREQQDEERDRMKNAADLRPQRERQAQDEARQAVASLKEQYYAQLPGPSHTGIR